jgi:hypothetical protein
LYLFRLIKKTKFLSLVLVLSCLATISNLAASSNYVSDQVNVVSAESDSIIARYLVQVIEKSQSRLQSFFNSPLRDSVTVILAACDTHFLRMTGNRLPEWTAAVAVPLYRKIILKPGAYFDPGAYSESLIHELAHIYMADKIDTGYVPLWLNEGVAMHLSGKSLSWSENISAGNAVFGNNLMSFSEIDQLLRFGTGKAQIAYFQSMLAVRYLLENYGQAELQNILNTLAAGSSIEQHFYNAYGLSYTDFEYNYQNWLRYHYRWMVVLQFEYLLWILILFLVFSAILMIRIRNRRKLSQWVEEDDIAQEG